jgi:hypothetical protein
MKVGCFSTRLSIVSRKISVLKLTKAGSTMKQQKRKINKKKIRKTFIQSRSMRATCWYLKLFRTPLAKILLLFLRYKRRCPQVASKRGLPLTLSYYLKSRPLKNLPSQLPLLKYLPIIRLNMPNRERPSRLHLKTITTSHTKKLACLTLP